MAPGLYRLLAAGILSLHAAYIAWVIFGAFFTTGRPRLATLHVATLVYGMVIEIFGFWCPLTALETWLEEKLWQGWIIAGANSVIICVIGMRTAQFGFLPGNPFCIGLYANNLWNWRPKTHTTNSRFRPQSDTE